MESINPIELGDAFPALSKRPEGAGLGLADGLSSISEEAAGSVADAELQAAARVKLSLGGVGKVFAVAGLALDDNSGRLASRLGSALAAVEPAPILLVDGNVSQPSQAAWFGLAARPGLLEVLRGTADLRSAAQSAGPANLFVLPLGAHDGSLASLLAGPNTAPLLREIRDRFRYVVVEVGLVQKAPDALLLAALTDGVVVAVSAGDRRRHELQGLKQDLDRMKIPLLGVILTTGKGRSKR
jgi:Mrp family chromosome partitioning ATPase